jgi:hypothetical protein
MLKMGFRKKIEALKRRNCDLGRQWMRTKNKVDAERENRILPKLRSPCLRKQRR